MKRPTVTLTLGLMLLASAPSAGNPAEPSFTKLLDGESFAQIQPFQMSINASGVVAVVVIQNDLIESIVRADGETVTTIADTSGAIATFSGEVHINDAGFVAFDANLAAPLFQPGVFAGNGGPLVTLGPVPSDPFVDPMYVLLAFDNSGLALMADHRGVLGRAVALVTGSGGSITTVYSWEDLPEEDIPQGSTVQPDNFYNGDLNESGGLAFVAGLFGGTFQWWFVYKGTASGGALTRVASPALTDPDFPNLGLVALNEAGTVAFTEGLWGGFMGIYAGADEASLSAVATTDDPYWNFGAGGVAINDSGTFMFSAALDAGGDGIFTGPDPVAGKVIATGDPLDGSIVSYLATNRFSLNDFGQMAFYAALDDGRHGVYRADPVSFIFADGFESGDVSAWSATSPAAAASGTARIRRFFARPFGR